MTPRPMRCLSVCRPVLAAPLVALIAGCGPVVYQVDLIEGTHAEFDIGDILFRGVLVVAERKDADRATLAATVINEGPRADVLESVSIGPAGSAVTEHPHVDLPPHAPVRLGPTGSVQVVLPDPADVYRLGEFVPLTLRLRDAGQITHQVLVQDAADYLAPVNA